MYSNEIMYTDNIDEYSIYCKLYINMKLKIKKKKLKKKKLYTFSQNFLQTILYLRTKLSLYIQQARQLFMTCFCLIP